ncbi:MAG: hypothetical protein QOG89_824 [Thermomicrobiales bacterium]|nr:hypothetical protein [Thermomicrobiales bacterium]
MPDSTTLRPIAITRPMLPPRPWLPGRETASPVALRHTADFLTKFRAGAGSAIAARMARRSLRFGGPFASLQEHRGFALPAMSLDLRHLVRRSSLSDAGQSRTLRWPVWSAPPAVAIPARHEHFLGLSVLSDEAAPAGWMPTSSAVDASLSDESTGSWEPTEVRSRTVPRAFVRPPEPTLFEESIPSRAPGAASRPVPLILHQPRTERSPIAVPGLAAMRRMAASTDQPASLITVAELATRIAATHAAPEIGATNDSPRSLGPVPRVGDGFLRQSQGRYFAAAHDAGGERGVYPRNILSEAKNLSPRNQSWQPETTRATGETEGDRRSRPRQNFTMDLLRHATWQPPHQIIGMPPRKQAAAAASGAVAHQTHLASRLDAGPSPAITARPSATAGPSTPRSMRIEPVETPLVGPLPPSTLAPPVVERIWRSPVAGVPSAMPAASSWSDPTPASLLPPFVAARLARVSQLATSPAPSGPIAESSDAFDTELRVSARGSRPRIGSPREFIASAQGGAPRPSGGASLQTGTAPTSFPAMLPTAVSPVAGPAAYATDLPMVMRRLSFGSERARQALTGTVSPVWGPLGRQVVPLGSSIPSASPGTPGQIPTDAATGTNWGAAPRSVVRSARVLPDTAVGRLSGFDAAMGQHDPFPVIPSSHGPLGSHQSTSGVSPSVLGQQRPFDGGSSRSLFPLPETRPRQPMMAGTFVRQPGTIPPSATRVPSPVLGLLRDTWPAMSPRAASPIVFRSPILDRAEPTAAQRAEAAEAMAASTGQPLPPIVRRSMEHQLGMDLAAVRVHSGPAVMRSTDLVAARAMARGTDVFLPGGVTDTPTAEGLPLLAHELTHVAHHLGHRAPMQPRPPMTLARRTSDEEHEADRIERRVADDLRRLPSLSSLPKLPSMPSMPSMPSLPTSPGAATDLLLAKVPQARALAGQVGQLGQQAEQAVGGIQSAATNAISSAVSPEAPAAAAPNPAELAEQVYQLLERRLIVERERAGFRR